MRETETHGAHTVTVGAADAGMRLDRWFRRQVSGLPQGRLERLLRSGQVRVDGCRAKAGHRLEAGQRVRVPPSVQPSPTAPAPRPRVAAADARDLRARVLYRDDDVLVIDKPAGLAVQGGSRTLRHLDDMLDALRLGAPERPRLVHRLDKQTSGVLVLARSARAAAALTRAFRTRAVRKVYWALTVGVPRPESGSIRLPLAKTAGRGGRERVRPSAEGRHAATGYAVVAQAGRKAAWVALEPETGRMHQLRAHLEVLGCPIVGDRKYGGGGARLGDLSEGLHLHAREIRLPGAAGRDVVVRAQLPPHMAETWAYLGFDPGDSPS